MKPETCPICGPKHRGTVESVAGGPMTPVETTLEEEHGWALHAAAAEAQWRREAQGEVARLRRVLAVEAGDESQAPREWRAHDATTWKRGDIRVARVAPRSWRWFLVSGRGGGYQSWPTALEAMEAADKAIPHEEP